MLRQVLGKPARLEYALLEAGLVLGMDGCQASFSATAKSISFLSPLQCIRKMECLGSTQLLEVSQTLQRVAGRHSLPSWKSLSHSPCGGEFQG